MRDRDLMAPAFPDDVGEVDDALDRALADYARGAVASPEVLAAITTARIVVPVVAVLGEMEIDEHGRAHDKTADMATVLLQGADGRTALLGFTSLDRLHAWQADARPVAVTARNAALAAVQDQADALVLDIAGPVTFAIEGDDLTALAAGWHVARVGDDLAWIGSDQT